MMAGSAFVLIGILLAKEHHSRFDQVALFLLSAALPCLTAYSLTEVKDEEEHDWLFVARMGVYILGPILFLLGFVAMLAAREIGSAILLLVVALPVYLFVNRVRRNIPK